MKKLLTILTAALFLFALATIYAFASTHAVKQQSNITISAADGNPHANGGGTTIEGGKVSTFVFNAVQHSDGSVNGHLNYMFREADINIQMDIDCLDINGNRATLSGTVTQVGGSATPPSYIFVGQRASFTVQDNGQGKGSAPDLISDLFLFGGASCANNWVTYLPISGNIDVKP